MLLTSELDHPNSLPWCGGDTRNVTFFHNCDYRQIHFRQLYVYRVRRLPARLLPSIYPARVSPVSVRAFPSQPIISEPLVLSVHYIAMYITCLDQMKIIITIWLPI